MIFDKLTGFAIADPKETVFSSQFTATKAEKEAFLKATILSVSGWRRVFAADGDEESTAPQINPPDKVLVASAARLFAEYLRGEKKIKKPLVVLGLDSRHTGPAIGLVILRALLAFGCSVRYIFIAGAPEIMAYTKITPEIDGFMYVSASHNPVGHNGLKFGLGDGAVLGKKDAQPLIDSFKKRFFDDAWVADLINAVNSVDSKQVEAVLNSIDIYKKEALQKYREFTDLVVTGIDDPAERNSMRDTIRQKIKTMGIGVLAEFNGSARSVSIDEQYLRDMGVAVTAINARPRQIVHRIVPEGKSLDLAKDELQKLAAQDARYRFAYVPDCDGDRGNIVTLGADGKAWVLEAQEVFALSVVSELAYLVYAGKLTYDVGGKPRQKVAVVVNDPTSGRVDRIAQAFGASVFRAEVGEANVVELATLKQHEGYVVRILGEGSNGGNITLPSTVRDPINTIFAFIKMLVLKSEKGKPGLFEIWCERSGQKGAFVANTELYHVAQSLPKFISTSAFEDRAIVKITTDDHGKLKSAYEKLFVQEWDTKKAELEKKFGITCYRVLNYEGSATREGMGARTGAQRGGFKVQFEDVSGTVRGFIWMRGSGTEPVFRVLADVEGDSQAAEKYLLDWHVSIIKKADQMCR